MIRKSTGSNNCVRSRCFSLLKSIPSRRGKGNVTVHTEVWLHHNNYLIYNEISIIENCDYYCRPYRYRCLLVTITAHSLNPKETLEA